MTQKQTAEVASLAVFGVGLIGVYVLATTLKDELGDIAIALIATIIFVAFYVLGQWVKRRINPPPAVK